MSEQLKGDVERARQFLDQHINAPKDFDAYTKEQLQQWGTNALATKEAGGSIRPFWLRRNGDSYTEFAAHIDYMLPARDEFRVYASVDISSDGGQSVIEVWLPEGDGSGEPIIAFQEAYTLESLDRAIRFAEESVQPQN